MRAAVMTDVRQPMKLVDIAAPEPGAGQVRIRVHASGLCGTDLHVIHGALPVPLPMVLGHEPVGVVEMLGPGVTRLRIGDRVGVSWTQAGCGRCEHCQRDRAKYCADRITWMTNGGGNSEFMIAEDTGCTILPDGVSWEDAAPMLCAGFTVMSGYRNGAPRPGDRVGVIGVGGLGHIAVQVAKAMGHEVVALTSTADKRDLLRQLGADEVLVIHDHAGRELQEAGGVDLLLSTSNSMAQNNQALIGLRPDGRLVTMAASSEPIQADPRLLLSRQLTIKGSTQNNREDLVDVLALCAAGRVKPMLEVYHLAEINAALGRLEEGKVRFRAVLTHDASS